MAGQGKPVLLAGTDVQVELVDPGLTADGELFSLRPLQDHPVPDLLDLEQDLQTLLRVHQVPLTLVLLLVIDGQIEHGAALLDLPRPGLLEFKVAPGPVAPAVDLGDEVGHAGPGFEIRAAIAERADEHLDAEAAAVGDDMDVGGGVAVRRLRRQPLTGHLDGRVHGHERGDVADGGEHLLAGRHRHEQTVAAGDPGHPSVFVADLDNPVPGACFRPDRHLALTDILTEMDEQGIVTAFHHQFRLAGNDLHRRLRRAAEKDRRVADERGQCLAGIEGVAAVAPLAPIHLPESGADLPVLTGQVFDLSPEKQPLEGDGAPLGPLAGKRSPLLLGDQFEVAVAVLDQPAETGAPFGLPHPPGDLDQFLQALLPGRVRGDDVGQETAVELPGESTGGLPHGGLGVVQGGKQFSRLHGHPEEVVAHRLVVQVAQGLLKIAWDLDPHPVERHDRHERGQTALVGHQAFGEHQHVRHDLVR